MFLQVYIFLHKVLVSFRDSQREIGPKVVGKLLIRFHTSLPALGCKNFESQIRNGHFLVSRVSYC